jgi:hypothetical protein
MASDTGHGLKPINFNEKGSAIRNPKGGNDGYDRWNFRKPEEALV